MHDIAGLHIDGHRTALHIDITLERDSRYIPHLMHAKPQTTGMRSRISAWTMHAEKVGARMSRNCVHAQITQRGRERERARAPAPAPVAVAVAG